MNLSDFIMIEKDDLPGGYQCVLEYSDTMQLSIISGAGAHADSSSPYEIALLVNGDFAQYPGITDNNDIRGYMTESEVDIVIKKLYTLTGNQPTQL